MWEIKYLYRKTYVFIQNNTLTATSREGNWFAMHCLLDMFGIITTSIFKLNVAYHLLRPIWSKRGVQNNCWWHGEMDSTMWVLFYHPNLFEGLQNNPKLEFGLFWSLLVCLLLFIPYFNSTLVYPIQLQPYW